MAAEPIIRGVDAHKVYNSGVVKVHALRGVNLAIPRGEMVAIMGPSGCGKTTLLNCFSGLDDLPSGDVLIEGVAPASRDENAKSRYRSRGMGFVFKTYTLLRVLRAGENVELPLLVAKAPAKEARRRALALMTAVELDGWADHKPAQLSAGQQQRVAIARALVNDPAIVWADEPTGNLDSETSAQIMDLLVRLNRDHRLEPGRRRHAELHLPRGRLRASRCDRRTRLEHVQRPALLVFGDELHADPRGPRDLGEPDRRHRARPPEDHARPERRREQGEPANLRDGPQRDPGERLRIADDRGRADGRHEGPRADGGVRERAGRGGPERDRGPGPHLVLRHHEPDDRPRDSRRDRAGHGQGRVRGPRDPVHRSGSSAGRLQRERRDQPNPPFEPRWR